MVDVDLQLACQASQLPTQSQFQQWAELATSLTQGDFELSIRIVEPEESQSLNNQYRGKDKPTNVLSFPADLPAELELPLLGDLVICADVVEQEAQAQNKALMDHWAHMVIHGILHLLGYDHIDDDDAAIMEAVEVKLLSSLAIKDPYTFI